MPWPLIRSALASVAHLTVLPMQDVLGLDGEHRMNIPGTTEDNWAWQFSWTQIEQGLADKLRDMLQMYRRIE
jgi:4-alpha-glucanotransferase